MKITKKDIGVLLVFIFLCLGVELAAGWLTAQNVKTWYPLLLKPAWTPPGYLFGPVWTLLYLLMAIALWIVWLAPVKESKISAYVLFGCQLFCNLIWSGLFFYLKSPLLGFIDIVLLWILIVMTIKSFYRIRPIAGYLLIPYILWVTYALTLNLGIYLLNR